MLNHYTSCPHPAEPIKKRLHKAGCLKLIRKKAVSGAELVAAGGLLTGELILMERLANPASPSISGQDVTYNSDTSPSIFQFELLQSGSKGSDKMSIPDILGWLIFRIFLVLLSILVIKVILKILRV